MAGDGALQLGSCYFDIMAEDNAQRWCSGWPRRDLPRFVRTAARVDAAISSRKISC